MELWTNPACSKCRSATAALREAGIDFVERRYLEDVPTTAELAEVLDRMGLQPWDLARPQETRQAGIKLPRDAEHREDWLVAMVAHPRTIQRPILTADDGTTVVARDAATLERVLGRTRR